MKSSHSIISLIKEQHQFQRLKTFDEINKLISSLPIQMRKYIAFGYQRGQNLYFALKNPTLISEYNTYHSQTIFFTLQAAQEIFPLIGKCQKITFFYPKSLPKNTTGRYFTPPKHYATYFEKVETIYIQEFTEQSQGIFVNHAKHPKLYKLFENIRKAIQEKCQSSKP